uniref:Uncharacterized protein n=1 Tax=Anopheles minimus TaxID=112268 RepID=A0A182WFF3_9DIPT
MKFALIISALLAVFAGLGFAEEPTPIPIFARSCSLCRMRGSPRSCTTVIRGYVQCNGMNLYSVTACTRRAGIYVTEPKMGCYMV